MESFDLVVIGAGPGGYIAAIRAAQLGLRAALVEKRSSLGGTCLNVGCIPSKALLESSELYAAARNELAAHGVVLESVSLDLETMMQRKQAIVDELVGGIAMLMKKNKIEVHAGTAELKGEGRVMVHGASSDTELHGDAIVLATGSLPIELPFMPFDGERVVSSTEALSFTEVPDHLLVVGGGAVGLELGSVWSRLGAKVTVVEMLPTITPFADSQMAKNLERALKDQGLDLRLKTKVTEAVVDRDGVTVTLVDDKDAAGKLTVDRVLVAVGRRPFTDGLGLEAAGLVTDESGRIEVDEHLRTAVDGIYAIGDLVRGPMLAHKAEDEGIAAAELIAGKAGHVSYGTIPNVVYTDPELAAVGKTESELKQEGVPFKAGRFQFAANGRAKSLGRQHGMVKILAHKETDRILGVHIVGPRASELIAEAVVAMEFAASAEDLARTVHAHPTLSEVVREAALAVDKRAIHG